MAVEYDGEPNGLKIHKDGRIFVADYRRGILQLDPASGALSPVVEHDQGQPFKGAKHNDMIEYLPPDRANQPFRHKPPSRKLPSAVGQSIPLWGLR